MEKITVATYNIRTDTEADGNWSWRNRRPHVLKLIRYHDWDIFGAQEVLPHQLKDLMTLGYGMAGLAREDGIDQGEYTALFYKKDKFDLLKKEAFWLSDTPDLPSIHPTAGCPRVCVCAFLKSKKTGREFAVATTHLDHLSAESRLFGAKIILETCLSKITDQPVILVGDFNAEPEEETYQLLTKSLTDAKHQKNATFYGPLGTFQDFSYNKPWQEIEEIDYIFVSEQLKVEKVAVLTDNCDCRYPSDHFPVVATLSLKG